MVMCVRKIDIDHDLYHSEYSVRQVINTHNISRTKSLIFVSIQSSFIKTEIGGMHSQQAHKNNALKCIDVVFPSTPMQIEM